MKKLFFGVVTLLMAGMIIAATVRKPVTSTAAIQVMTGSSVTAADGTVTNTFGTVFSALPNVVVCQFGLVVSVTNTFTSLTVSNFIYKSNVNAVSNHWIAIGAP